MPSPLGITTSGERGILFKYKYNSSSNSNSSGSGQNVRSSFKINYNTNENLREDGSVCDKWCKTESIISDILTGV